MSAEVLKTTSELPPRQSTAFGPYRHPIHAACTIRASDNPCWRWLALSLDKLRGVLSQAHSNLT
jgi:hypothetical protein